jgi:hypothetical protein
MSLTLNAIVLAGILGLLGIPVGYRLKHGSTLVMSALLLNVFVWGLVALGVRYLVFGA